MLISLIKVENASLFEDYMKSKLSFQIKNLVKGLRKELEIIKSLFEVANDVADDLALK